VPVGVEDFDRQARAVAEAAASADPPAAEVDLYNSGSFLADDEVPPAARDAILARIAAVPSVRHVLVEARPEHVTADKVEALVRALPGRSIAVGIGLETADDAIRAAMRKGFTAADFARAARVLADAGVGLLAYVFLKPPGLTEDEARRDASATLAWLVDRHPRGSLHVALQPAFVARGTDLECEFLAGRYTPPSLWTVARVVAEAPEGLALHVALWDEGLSDGRVAAGCDACTPRLRAALEAYNATGDRSALAGLACEACGRRTP
jgi:radical SAM enzyme (TIGR01210 family)